MEAEIDVSGSVSGTLSSKVLRTPEGARFYVLVPVRGHY